MSSAEKSAQLAPFWPVLTTALIALCTIAFLTLWVVGLTESLNVGSFLRQSLWAIPNDNDLLTRFGALELTRVWIDQEWWRVLSAPFLHGSWIHLILNMIALWSIGGWVELVWGRAIMFILFLLASIGGCLASLLWAEALIIVGASGGILGLAGTLWVARTKGDQNLRDQLEPISARQLGIMIGLVIVLGAMVPIIAQAGHLGGLVVGLIAAAFLVRRRPTAALLSSLLSVGIMVPLAASPTWRTNYHTYLGFRYLRGGDDQQALRFLEAALERTPEDASLANAVAYELSLQGVQLERATELVSFALKQDPENPDYLDTRGWILCRQGDHTEGTKWLRRAVAADDDPPAEILGHVEGCLDAAVSRETDPRPLD